MGRADEWIDIGSCFFCCPQMGPCRFPLREHLFLKEATPCLQPLTVNEQTRPLSFRVAWKNESPKKGRNGHEKAKHGTLKRTLASLFFPGSFQPHSRGSGCNHMATPAQHQRNACWGCAERGCRAKRGNHVFTWMNKVACNFYPTIIIFADLGSLISIILFLVVSKVLSHNVFHFMLTLCVIEIILSIFHQWQD